MAATLWAGCRAFLTNDRGLLRVIEFRVLVPDDLEGGATWSRTICPMGGHGRHVVSEAFPNPVRRRLERAELIGGSSQPPQHEARHRQVNPGLAGLGQQFVVLAHTAVEIEPSEGAFDNPAPFQDLEASRVGGNLLTWADPDGMDALPAVPSAWTPRPSSSAPPRPSGQSVPDSRCPRPPAGARYVGNAGQHRHRVRAAFVHHHGRGCRLGGPAP